MNDLNKLIISCRSTEINGMADRIIEKYNEDDWSFDNNLTGYLESLKTENEKLTTAINRTKAKSNLKEKDETRSKGVKGINNLLSGFLLFSDTAIKSAAVKVSKVFKRYGVKIIRESFVTTTSLINSLLEDFSAAEVKSAIDKLPGLPILLAELTAAQNDFETARVNYESAIANEKNFLTATQLRNAIGLILNDEIIPYLNVMKKLDADKYSSFALAVRKIIDNTNEQIKKRRKISSQPKTPTEE